MELVLPSEYGLLVVGLYVLGMFIKGIPNVPNWLIPFALMLIGVVGAIAISGFDVNAIVGGVVSSGLAVYGDQLWKQAKEGISPKQDAKDVLNR